MQCDEMQCSWPFFDLVTKMILGRRGWAPPGSKHARTINQKSSSLLEFVWCSRGQELCCAGWSFPLLAVEVAGACSCLVVVLLLLACLDAGCRLAGVVRVQAGLAWAGPSKT